MCRLDATEHRDRDVPTDVRAPAVDDDHRDAATGRVWVLESLRRNQLAAGRINDPAPISKPVQSPGGGAALSDGQRRRRAKSSHLLTAAS
jgi:hypothetical protein